MSGNKGLILLVTLLITAGCTNHVIEINATSLSDCYLDCKFVMKGHFCFSAVPMYEYKLIDGNKTDGKCECILEDCLR